MELIFFGVGIGMILSAALVGLGVEIGQRHHTDVLDADTDTLIYVPHRDRDRSGGDGCDKQHTTEEKIMVLNTLRVGSTWYEKAIIDEIADDLIKLSKQEGSSEHE